MSNEPTNQQTTESIIEQQQPAIPAAMMDIWSRPGLWAKQRAYIFLTINLLVFASLNIFIFWIHQARLFDFSWQSYTVTYHKTLIDFLIFPINIREAPVLIPIMGMLMANIIIVPILISQLYGFRFSTIFCLCVLVFAHLPVLAFFLMASCFIVSAGKYKLPFKFGVALLGLLPLAIYFYVATSGANMLRFKPVDPTLLYAPWVFAFLAAALIAAAVLAFARLVKYRPGGILVGMIPFFAIPVILFQTYIGPDQLEFRLLVHRYGPDSAFYTPVDISANVFHETLRVWRRYKVRDLQAIVNLATSEFPNVATQLLQENRSEILDVFGRFQTTYPNSRFVPNALYLYGLGQDLRFNFGVLQRNWMVEYSSDLVSPLSAETWKKLADNYPKTIYAEPARLRLAILAVREKKIDQALKLLDDLLKSADLFQDDLSTRPAEPVVSFGQLFEEPTQTEIPPIDLPDLISQAQELRSLIINNGHDPRFNTEPLAEFLKLDPSHLKYRDHLLELAIRFSDAKLHDNLLVRYAETDPDPAQRRILLERYADYFKGEDAGAEALYELASLLQAWGLANMDSQAYNQAEMYYKRVIRDYPDSLYTPRAAERLRQFQGIARQL
jgi:outer membrane protein assembly factor BamD (BamD/ComL family)